MERRFATVTTTGLSHFVCIDRDALRKILEAESKIQTQARLDAVLCNRALQLADDDTRMALLRHCKMLKFEAGTTILPARCNRPSLYFILNGHCKVMRTVPFRRQTSAPFDIRPLEPGVTDINPAVEECILQSLHAGDLSAGDYFPRLNLTRSEFYEYKAQRIPLPKLVAMLEALLAHGPRQFEDALLSSESRLIFPRPADSTKIVDMTIPQEAEEAMAAFDLEVTATDRVDCLQISKVDFVKIIDERTLRMFMDAEFEGVVGAAMHTLQETYLERVASDRPGPVRDELASSNLVSEPFGLDETPADGAAPPSQPRHRPRRVTAKKSKGDQADLVVEAHLGPTDIPEPAMPAAGDTKFQ
ncbi:hypothetical protein HK105_200927 [Polyrhizophydium stewartii]|uniref:Cyclic nucleotide-binding domain-containing protein n=1 Tax=Polyrhizophydium stewartii TaxID=2732419 RepID=A0ABR4NIC8_9FUNG